MYVFIQSLKFKNKRVWRAKEIEFEEMGFTNF